MPFDVLGNSSFTLADHLDVLGIRPVPMDQLTAYKAEQIRLHPKHLLLRNWPALTTFAVYTIGSIYKAEPLTLIGAPWWAWAGVIAGCALVGAVLTAVTYIMISMVLSAAGVRLKTQAYWHEHDAFLPALPTDIRTIARKISRNMPAATFRIGELIQKDIVIDPYLLVRFKGETACIGIWDFDERDWPRIVAIAEMD